MNQYYKFFAILTLVLLFISCKKEKENPTVSYYIKFKKNNTKFTFENVGSTMGNTEGDTAITFWGNSSDSLPRIKFYLEGIQNFPILNNGTTIFLGGGISKDNNFIDFFNSKGINYSTRNLNYNDDENMNLYIVNGKYKEGVDYEINFSGKLRSGDTLLNITEGKLRITLSK